MNDNYIEETFALMANTTANTTLAAPSNAGNINGYRNTIAYPLTAPSYHYGNLKQQQWPFAGASMPSVVPSTSVAAFPHSLVHSAPSATPGISTFTSNMPPLTIASTTNNVSAHAAPIAGGTGAFLDPTAVTAALRPLFPAPPALVPSPLASNMPIATNNSKTVSKTENLQEMATNMTAIRKSQFVSFCRWFEKHGKHTKPSDSVDREEVKPPSTLSMTKDVSSEYHATAFVFNAASPNYLVGAYSLESSSSSSSSSFTVCHSWMMEVDVQSGSIRRQWESPDMPKTKSISMKCCDSIREIGRDSLCSSSSSSSSSSSMEDLTVLHQLADLKEVLQEEGERSRTKVVLLEEVPSWLK